MKKIMLILILGMVLIVSSCSNNNKVDNLTTIDEESKEEAIRYIIEDNDIVEDAAIKVIDGNEVRFVLIVKSHINQETIEELGDSFPRLLSSTVARKNDVKPPGHNYLGELFEQYDLEVVFSSDGEETIAHGVKMKNSNKIRW